MLIVRILGLILAAFVIYVLFLFVCSLFVDVANGLGGSVPGMQHMLHLASCTLRPLSPVAGVVIAVAGATGLSPFALVRRTWFPMIASTLFAFVLTMILY